MAGKACAERAGLEPAARRAAGTVLVAHGVDAGGAAVRVSLYQLKAELFRTMGHPVRARVLELLCDREYAVAELLPHVGVEPAHLSQQLAVLRRANLVVTRKEAATVYYALASPQVGQLLSVAPEILSGILAEQAELLDDLRATSPDSGTAGTDVR